MSEPTVDAMLAEEGTDAVQAELDELRNITTEVPADITCHDCGTHDKCVTQQQTEQALAEAQLMIERLEARVAELENDWRELMRERSDWKARDWPQG